MNHKRQFPLSIVITSFLIGSLLTYVIVDFDSGKFNKMNKDEVSLVSSSTQIKDRNDQRSKDLQKLTETLRKRQLEMDKRMEKMLNRAFDQRSAFSFGSVGFDSDFGDDFQVEEREDEDYKYIDIIADGIDKEGINISIEDGMIRLSGEIIKEETSAGSSFKSISKFNRSFNVPYGVDETKANFETKGNRFTIKFPKRG